MTRADLTVACVSVLSDTYDMANVLAENSYSDTMPARFWAKVQKTGPEECWLWSASLNGAGYGQIGRGSGELGMDGAHRVSWILHFGNIPEGSFVLHHCDVKTCVNPAHLFLGTHSDNMRDMDEKGRRVTPPRPDREEHNKAKLTDAQHLEIRADPRPSKRVAPEYGVHSATVRRHRRGSAWINFARNVRFVENSDFTFRGWAT